METFSLLLLPASTTQCQLKEVTFCQLHVINKVEVKVKAEFIKLFVISTVSEFWYHYFRKIENIKLKGTFPPAGKQANKNKI